MCIYRRYATTLTQIHLNKKPNIRYSVIISLLNAKNTFFSVLGTGFLANHMNVVLVVVITDS